MRLHIVGGGNDGKGGVGGAHDGVGGGATLGRSDSTINTTGIIRATSMRPGAIHVRINAAESTMPRHQNATRVRLPRKTRRRQSKRIAGVWFGRLFKGNVGKMTKKKRGREAWGDVERRCVRQVYAELVTPFRGVNLAAAPSTQNSLTGKRDVGMGDHDDDDEWQQWDANPQLSSRSLFPWHSDRQLQVDGGDDSGANGQTSLASTPSGRMSSSGSDGNGTRDHGQYGESGSDGAKQPMRLFVGTWNVNAKSPSQSAGLFGWLQGAVAESSAGRGGGAVNGESGLSAKARAVMGMPKSKEATSNVTKGGDRGGGEGSVASLSSLPSSPPDVFVIGLQEAVSLKVSLYACNKLHVTPCTSCGPTYGHVLCSLSARSTMYVVCMCMGGLRGRCA